ncbi:MAG: sigma-70 family RNA polymerase sigma factor [Bacteroidetes bacterium]|nr:sigma-70 family RNA polymerase sigma factor [Bacteroidota bacterium]
MNVKQRRSMLNNASDDEIRIAEGCKRRDARIQKQVFEKYYGLMLTICMRYTQSKEDARDVLQEGFVKIFEKIDQYDFKHSFSGWMKRIMVNTAIDRYRKDVKMPMQDDEEILLNESIDPDAISQLSEEEILACIQRLPTGYRTVFSMYVIEGYNHKEIGEKLGIAEGTSKSQLAKAKALLQKKIEGLTALPHNHGK